MNLLSLFISNSDDAEPVRVQDMLYMGVWIIVALAVIDVAINILFPYPTDPKNISPSRLQSYFDYGRSSEGKLHRLTRVDPAQTAPITLAGWYSPIHAEGPEESSDAPIVTFYGMSHAVQLANALDRVTKKYVPRIVAAPGASGNWSYGAYLRDRGGGKSHVAVLALMAANLPMITSVSPINWNWDAPMPYMADRFILVGDELGVIHPPFDSFVRYTDAFFDPEKWETVRKTMKKTDSLYDALLSRASILDRSALARLARRAYGQRLGRTVRDEVFDRDGFNADSEQIKLARAIITAFAERVRAQGIIPVIYIVNNLGYSDKLFRALEPVLAEHNIPYLSSHNFASPSDPRKYLANSHFVDEVDEAMARELVKMITEIDTTKK